jgi:2-polyprenyl-3-methyl-5-hydroxy-6-metoxy-1,4-benzoquinol methylase
MTSERSRSLRSDVIHDHDCEQELAALLEPGMRANAWRPDYEHLHKRRLWNELYQDYNIDLLQRRLGQLGDRLILDVGMGRGGLCVALRRAGNTVVGLDLRRRNCRITRLRGRRYDLPIPVIQARAEHLPIASDSVDVVICRDVLEHVDRPNAMLTEVHRVLRRSGACFITVINRLCWVDPHYHLAGLSLMPRSLAERYIAWRGRTKVSGRDRQCVSDMHYYTYGAFVRQAERVGFWVDDPDLAPNQARVVGMLRR